MHLELLNSVQNLKYKYNISFVKKRRNKVERKKIVSVRADNNELFRFTSLLMWYIWAVLHLNVSLNDEPWANVNILCLLLNLESIWEDSELD